MAPALTKRKKEILDFIQDYQAENGYFPTLEEIADHFELKSTATVHQHLTELEELGLLYREYNRARDMEIRWNQDTPRDVLPTAGAAKNKSDVNKSYVNESYVSGNSLELPIAGLITAGLPIEAVEDTSETLTVPRHMLKNENSYVLKVKGDSMIESLISDGDYVIVQKQDFASDGDIVVALLDDGSATLKEYHKEKNYIRLQPRNKNYKPIKVKNVIIQGRVLGIIRKFSSN